MKKITIIPMLMLVLCCFIEARPFGRLTTTRYKAGQALEKILRLSQNWQLLRHSIVAASYNPSKGFEILRGIPFSRNNPVPPQAEWKRRNSSKNNVSMSAR